MTINDLTDEIKKRLSRRRFEHSLSVARLAAKLGRSHGWAPAEAYRAGLLHDCVKEWSPRKLIAQARRRKLDIPGMDFIIRTNPNMLHAYVGASEAKRRQWLSDPRSLQAIASHTLGHTAMTVADKILYVADLASPDRGYAKALKIRRLARTDLDGAFALACAVKMKQNLKRRRPIHPYTLKVWNQVVCKINK